jgi:hypothetical protein
MKNNCDQHEYETKVKNLIHENQFTIIINNPTQYFQKAKKRILKHCNNKIKYEMEIHNYETRLQISTPQ